MPHLHNALVDFDVGVEQYRSGSELMLSTPCAVFALPSGVRDELLTSEEVLEQVAVPIILHEVAQLRQRDNRVSIQTLMSCRLGAQRSLSQMHGASRSNLHMYKEWINSTCVSSRRIRHSRKNNGCPPMCHISTASCKADLLLQKPGANEGRLRIHERPCLKQAVGLHQRSVTAPAAVRHDQQACRRPAAE